VFQILKYVEVIKKEAVLGNSYHKYLLRKLLRT